MTTSRPTCRIPLGLGVVAVLLALAGCSGSVSVGGPKSVDAGDVEAQVSTALGDQGRTGAVVSCPDDLPAEKGATTQCDSTDDQGMMRATATVISVQGGDVKFDIAAVPVISAEDAAQQAGTQLAAQLGVATPPAMSCPGELVGEVGTTLVCTLSDAGQAYDTTLTVTDDGNGQIGFDIEVADTPS